jgi:hypothetical protein
VRYLLLVLLVAGVGCRTGEEGARWPSSGDSCGVERLGYQTCGLSTGKQEVVLRCELVGVDALWVGQQTCELGCEKAKCRMVSPTGDIGVTDHGGTDLPDFRGEGRGRVDAAPGVEFGCTPGHTQCIDGVTVGVCDEDGGAFLPLPCPEGQGCQGGYCTPQSCVPGEAKGECFSSTEYLVCNAGGTNWSAAPCEGSLTCYKGDCVDWECNPGETICKGLSSIQECQESSPDKWAWVVTEACSSGLCKEGACVGACEVNHKLNTYLGCNYWAVDLDNIEGGQQEAVGLVVSAPEDGQPAVITITNTTSGQVLTSADLGGAALTVEPGALQIYKLPAFYDIDGSSHTNRSFRVDATQPVTVHQFNPLVGDGVFTNDASLLLPDYAGGLEYLVMSWKLRTSGATLRGFFTVIATQAGVTKVSVKGSAGIIAGSGVPSMTAGLTKEFNLQQGDVLNLEVSGSEGADLTGSMVTADQKVAVFGGHECANIHVGFERCDHIEQQLFPLATWGKEYVGDAFYPRTSGHVDTWRILAGEDGTTVTLDPPVAGPFSLNKGQWVEFDTGDPFVATSDGKFLLGHYLQSCNYPGYEVFCSDSVGQLGIGDPAFTLSPPVGQYLEGYVFLTPESYSENYVNVVFEVGTTVTLDDAPLTQPGVPIGQSGLVLVQEPVAAGVHTLGADRSVGVTAYGYGCHVSYAYPGGLKLEEL